MVPLPSYWLLAHPRYGFQEHPQYGIDVWRRYGIQAGQAMGFKAPSNYQSQEVPKLSTSTVAAVSLWSWPTYQVPTQSYIIYSIIEAR